MKKNIILIALSVLFCFEMSAIEYKTIVVTVSGGDFAMSTTTNPSDQSMTMTITCGIKPTTCYSYSALVPITSEMNPNPNSPMVEGWEVTVDVQDGTGVTGNVQSHDINLIPTLEGWLLQHVIILSPLTIIPVN